MEGQAEREKGQKPPLLLLKNCRLRHRSVDDDKMKWNGGRKKLFRAVSQQRRKCTSFLPPLPPFFPLSPPCNFGTVEAVCGGEKIGGHASFIQHFYGTKSNNAKNTKDFQTAIFFKKYFFLVMQIILSSPFLRNRGIFFGGPP